MNADEMNDADWFPETFSDPCGDFRALLNDQCLVEKIAMTRCVHDLCPHLRGDGKTPGHSIITYGLPMFFPVQIAHPQTRFLAELAGITPRKKTLGVNYAPPCAKAVAEAVKSIRAALAIRLHETADRKEVGKP